MTAKKIAVVGASVRAAAFSLLRTGHQVVAADLFADADLAQHCPVTRISPYPEGFAHWLASIECDAWLYTGALENSPALVDRLAASQHLQGHTSEVLRRVRDPLQLQAALHKADLLFPETKPANAKKPKQGRWLGKTYQGSSGSGVGVDAGANYWQKHMDGTPLSATFRGSRLLGVTRQLVGEPWAGAGPFQYCGSIGPWPLSASYQQQLRQLGEVLSGEFGLTDVYGVDLLLDDDRLWTIEVNPRYTASMEIVERAYGLSVFAENDLQRNTNLEGYFGKVVLFAKTALIIGRAMSMSLQQSAGNLPWPQIADIPVPGTKIEVGQPVLTLLAEGDSCDAVAQRLRQRVISMEDHLGGV